LSTYYSGGIAKTRLKVMPMTLAFLRPWLVTLGLAVAASATWAQDVTGAGATFRRRCTPSGPTPTTRPPAPHQLPVGRLGRRLKQIRSKTVDFGASDMPLKDDELARTACCSSPP
jgi:phosphate transport system substrate-binding protein